ncbi:glycosyltransferase family 4 protein [Chitinispirillales bacterium ANBcel5]|uniref:glycosyltransferase family 4 protein n=1 Tax=Cellulosispirillum alkaliphilum TaxID=3039283 RepID=UPI002A55B936|nr:glycosyltransferase family 4 protein [Chitinispirillales bacterium ANBcel5]
MNILHIVSGNLNGGAFRGAYWLHKGLQKIGVDSIMLTNSRDTGNDDSIVSIRKNPKSKIVAEIRPRLDRLPLLFYRNRSKKIFSTAITGFDFTKTAEYRNADIIHLHWINAGFVNIKDLKQITKPIVWTLRDMWPMTGGCHYSIQCNNFKTGCGNCWQLSSKRSLDLSRFILKRKLKHLPYNMKLIGISNWMSSLAQSSILFKQHDIRTIYNNINCKEFFSIEKTTAREILGIKTDKKILLCGSTNISDFYKGFSKLADALQNLNKNRIMLLFFGSASNEFLTSLGYEYKSLGFLNDNISLRLAYSASDVFVAPSLMDAFGKTIAESMACGTPTVCFNATGPGEIVDHKINGYAATPFEPDDLAKGIKWVLEHPNYQALTQKARKKVLTNFDNSVIAKKYYDLYQELLNNATLTAAQSSSKPGNYGFVTL